LVSSSDWAPTSEGSISSEDKVARKSKAPGAKEISLLEKNEIVPIGGKKRAEFE